MARSGGRARVGILGGTLDPVHCGHVQAAIAVRDALALTNVLLLPSHVPPHRPRAPEASSFHRFAMAALAVNGVPGLQASDDELRNAGPTYTADTLDRLRSHGLLPSQIFFITGADAFAEIATWHRYPDVLDLANFVVISRPRHDLAMLHQRLPSLASRMKNADDFASPSDATIVLLAVSTPDVSSTAIRERLRRGESIGGLVPPLVETHIHQHRLYTGTPEGVPYTR